MRYSLVLVGVMLLSTPVHEAEATKVLPTLRTKVRSFFVTPSNKPSRLQTLLLTAGMAALTCFSYPCVAVKANDTPLPLVKEEAAISEHHFEVAHTLVRIASTENGEAVLDRILRQWWDRHGGIGKLIRAALAVDDREPLAGMVAKLTQDEIAVGLQAGLLAAVETKQYRLVHTFYWVADRLTIDTVLQQVDEHQHEKIHRLLLAYKQRKLNLWLNEAAKQGNLEEMQLLLEQGANNLHKALQLALHANQTQAVSLLLKHGANPDAGLSFAANVGNRDQAALMLAKGATNHNYALRQAVTTNKVKIVKLLLEHGADPNEGLRKAARFNQPEMVKLLVQLGADELDTALHEAIAAYRPDTGMQTIELLLTLGAKTTQEDKHRLEKLRRLYPP